MNKLIVQPTARAIRNYINNLRSENRLLPKCMRMDDFISRVAVIPDRAIIDGVQRALYLREASNFKEFAKLKQERELIRFFTASNDFFRFFEELAGEMVPVEDLAMADAYAEFSEHIDVLRELRENYRELLERDGLSDRIFLSESYILEEGFISSFEEIDIYLSGYPTRFELKLFEDIAKITKLKIYIRFTRFNKKVSDRFRELGVDIPQKEGFAVVDMSRKSIESFKEYPLRIKGELFSVSERWDQVALAMEKIEEMVRSGISPENIALVLPDENFKEAFELYDRLDNFNFAMGFDISHIKEYQIINALLEYWRDKNDISKEYLIKIGLPIESIDALNPNERYSVDEFLDLLDKKDLLPDLSDTGSDLKSLFYTFKKLFHSSKFKLKEWFSFWLRELDLLRIDDIRGGKVTVMGVLETRGMSYDGIVIVDFNEEFAPAKSGKDRFLNSNVRAFAKLPLKEDRESLQKHYYATFMERAKSLVIIYSTSDNRLPSRFIYELGLSDATEQKAPRYLLYEKNSLKKPSEPVVDSFRATDMRWSNEMLKSWLKCKREFYYRYIEKLKADENSDEVKEGREIHKILQNLYSKKRYFSSKEEMRYELFSVMEKSLPNNSVYKYYKELWLKSMEKWIEKEIERFENGWSIIDTEKSVYGEIEGIRFYGRIDRIDKNQNGEFYIIDYKTGKIENSKNFENIKDFQLVIYHLILKSIYPKLNAGFIKPLEEGEIVELKDIDDKKEVLKTHLKELKETKTFTAEKCENITLCKYCSYRLLCERGEYL